MVSNPMSGLPVPPNAMQQYIAGVAIESVWAVLEAIAAALPLPKRFTDAHSVARKEFFSQRSLICA